MAITVLLLGAFSTSVSAQGPEQQRLMHEQVFSARDIVYRGDRMQFVDVTDLLVIFFDPTEETLGIIESMRGVPAIPSQFITEYD